MPEMAQARHAEAVDIGGYGKARALIDPTQLTADTSGGVVEVLLVGRISGTVVAQRVAP